MVEHEPVEEAPEVTKQALGDAITAVKKGFKKYLVDDHNTPDSKYRVFSSATRQFADLAAAAETAGRTDFPQDYEETVAFADSLQTYENNFRELEVEEHGKALLESTGNPPAGSA